MSALEYAFATGTEDVQCALRWLLDNDFALERARGGPEESFGDVWLLFSRDDCQAEMTRDRSQWALALRPAWATEPLAFEIVLAAMTGRPPPQRDEPAWDTLPEQLPAEVLWCKELPDAVGWLTDPGSRTAVAEAEFQWRAY